MPADKKERPDVRRNPYPSSTSSRTQQLATLGRDSSVIIPPQVSLDQRNVEHSDDIDDGSMGPEGEVGASTCVRRNTSETAVLHNLAEHGRRNAKDCEPSSISQGAHFASAQATPTWAYHHTDVAIEAVEVEVTPVDTVEEAGGVGHGAPDGHLTSGVDSIVKSAIEFEAVEVTAAAESSSSLEPGAELKIEHPGVLPLEGSPQASPQASIEIEYPDVLHSETTPQAPTTHTIAQPVHASSSSAVSTHSLQVIDREIIQQTLESLSASVLHMTQTIDLLAHSLLSTVGQH